MFDETFQSCLQSVCLASLSSRDCFSPDHEWISQSEIAHLSRSWEKEILTIGYRNSDYKQRLTWTNQSVWSWYHTLLSSPSPVPNASPNLGPKSNSQIQVPNPKSKSQIQSPEERDWDWGWHLTFLDLPWVHDLLWPSMTFYDLLSPSKTSMTFYD